MKTCLIFFFSFLTINGIAQNSLSLQSQWTIACFYKNDSAIYPQHKNCTVFFEDTSFIGKAGCRDINGKMVATKNTLKIYTINSNKIFCKNTKEAVLFISFLLKANRYSINAGELTLYYNQQKLMLLESWRN